MLTGVPGRIPTDPRAVNRGTGGSCGEKEADGRDGARSCASGESSSVVLPGGDAGATGGDEAGSQSHGSADDARGDEKGGEKSDKDGAESNNDGAESEQQPDQLEGGSGGESDQAGGPVDAEDDLAAWCEFAEDDLSGSVRTLTPLGSSSSSEAPAQEHALDDMFFDEVFSGNETQAGACVFHTKEDFFAFILISSAVALTERQFNISRAFSNAGRERGVLPSYCTTTRRIVPAAIKAGGLSLESLDVDGFKCSYVLPSTHVARDLAFKDTYDLFFKADDRPQSMRELQPEFYDTTFFQNKAAVLQPVLPHASVSINGTRLKRGSWLGISLEGSEESIRVVVDNFYVAGADKGVHVDQGLHAGDFVVVCHSEEGEGAGVLVSRHWLPPELDALAWIPEGDGGSCVVVQLEHDGSQGHGDVAGQGSSAYPPFSSTMRRVRGVGADGVPTLVVCMALYADDFVCRERQRQSAGGVYMYYPGWCVADRLGSSAVRTISVTPAGVNSDEILAAITDNLVEGSTKGWSMKDYNGAPVRVYADVSFFVGDYVQVSKSSRMRGHNALAPCPLCSYSLPEGVGAQYACTGSAADVGLMRTTARTGAVLQAVRDLVAGE